MRALSGLTHFIGQRGERAGVLCELCGAELLEPHRHVIDLEARTLCCACEPCSMLFKLARAGGRFRTSGDRLLADPELALTPAQWLTRIGISAQLTFLSYSSPLERWLATASSPAGPIEIELDAEDYAKLEELSPLFCAVEPDIEALLVRHKLGAPALDCFLVPIDICYRLVDQVTELWTLEAGEVPPAAIDQLFAELARRSRAIRDSD